MKATIKNTGTAPQGVHTVKGIEFIKPGTQRTVEIADGDANFKRLSRLPFLKIEERESSSAARTALPNNVMQLKKIAKDEEIDLGDARSAADIRAAIELSREERDGAGA